MDNLSNNIYIYYLEHFTELPPDKQFHFASRLYLWHESEACRKILANLRPWFSHNNNPEAALRDIITEASTTSTHGSKNAAVLRRAFFERYPKLKTYVSVLFRITFLYTIYGIDCRPIFHKLFPQTEVEEFAHTLLQDPAALSMLSTHAVNFLYLYNGIIKADTSLIELDTFTQLRPHYNLQNPVHLQLLIYLYTHCIIGESLFYYRPLPEARLGTCQSMIDELEQLIGERFQDVNLDSKCEFLVSSRLVGHDSQLEQAILAEAEQSISTDGHFLVDRHNKNPQTANVTLDAAEHRNVLFVMAHRPFTPGRRPSL